MTAHAPIGLNPAAFGVSFSGPEHLGFVKNNLRHEDPLGADHNLFGKGLRISLYNYMNGAGFNLALSKWFDFKIPATSIPPQFILQEIKKLLRNDPRQHHSSFGWVQKLNVMLLKIMIWRLLSYHW